MGVRNDDPVLLSLLKKAYDSISANEIIAIQRRWLNMPTEKPTTNLTQEEQNFIKKHQTIQVGVDLNFAPFEFLNPQTGVQGLQSRSDHGTLPGLKSLFLNDMVMANKVLGIQDLCQHF